MSIISYNFIRCDRCGKTIEIGQDAFEFNFQYLCEACFDEAEEQMKKDARVQVNPDNFELEEEVPDLGQ